MFVFVCCLLFVGSLFVVCCSLVVVCCALFVVGCVFHVCYVCLIAFFSHACYLSFRVAGLLFLVSCLVVCGLLVVVCCSLFVVFCRLAVSGVVCLLACFVLLAYYCFPLVY